jgi:protein TonB
VIPSAIAVTTAAPAQTPANVPSGAALPSAKNALSAGSAQTASNTVELPSSEAQYLHNPKPTYPRASRQRGEQGRVVVNVLIGTDGTAQQAEIKVSSGFERLDLAALRTAKAWRYVPGKRSGVPEAMWYAVPLNFVMEGE